MNWVKRCTQYKVSGDVGRERGRKIWKECVENELKRLNLEPSIAADRGSWRQLVPVSVSPVLAWNMTLNDRLID